jgi:hypothetical protein
MRAELPADPDLAVVDALLGEPVDDGVPLASPDAARRQLERLLPAVDGVAVAHVGSLAARRGCHAAGTIYGVLTADSADGAIALQQTLIGIARLTDEEWRYGWRSVGRRRLAIRIYPDLASR